MYGVQITAAASYDDLSSGGPWTTSAELIQHWLTAESSEPSSTQQIVWTPFLLAVEKELMELEPMEFSLICFWDCYDI
jgi:hypothetical protein